MSAVRGLQSYIAKTAAARERVDLGHNQSRRAKRRSKPRLLCDFSSVVEWALSAYDAYLVRTGQLSVYSLLYGGDPALYRKRILAFVRALKHVGVAPVFFMEGAPGANFEHFTLQYPELLDQHEHLLEHCVNVYQVCEGTGDLLRVCWQLSREAESEITSCLQSEGVPLRYCARGTTLEMIEYQRRHRSVLGVLSSNADFAIAAGSKLFPLSRFDLENDLDIGSASIYPIPEKIACERVDPSTLGKSLQLTEERSLIDVSILCGNRFTARLNNTCKVIRDLGILGKGFEQVARSVDQLNEEQWQYIIGRLQNNYPYCKAIAQSLECYALPELVRDSSSPLNIVGQKASKFGSCEVLRVERKLYDATHAAVANGVYWRFPVLEPKNLGQPCFFDLTLPLRKTAYSLLGRESVCEYGSTSTKSFDEVCVSGDAVTNSFVDGMSDTERLVALFVLLTPYTGERLANLPGEVASVVKELDKDLLPFLPAMVLPCASLCFMQHLVSEHSYQLEPDDLQALLVTCVFCCVSTTPIVIPEQPSSRILRVAMHFSHVLQQARLLASTLHVMDSLPLPSSVFYPMAFIPHSMAALTNNNPSPNLREAFHNSQLVLNKPPIQELLLEITRNWHQPNASLLLRLFSKAIVCVENLSVYLFQGLPLSPPPPPLQHIFEKKANGDTSDLSNESDALIAETAGDSEMLNFTDQLVPEVPYYFEEGEEEGNAEVDDEGGKEETSQQGEEVCSEVNGVENGVGEEAESVNEEVLESPFELHSSQPSSVESECEEELSPPHTPSSISSSSISLPPTPSPSASPQSERRQYVDLPISAHRRKLLELVEENQVVCVEGETGCGKSTRVPQYILEHSLSRSPPRPCRILITQPRRMAAVKLAERVANERGECVGHTVGYCVGGDRTNLSGAAITYCTTGYFLQTLVHNPDTVSKYTHIILDEIHERSTDADFTLLVVRELLETQGQSVKLIIMSATMQSSLVVKYLKESFERVAGPYFVGVKNYGVDTYFIDEVGNIPPNQSFWDEVQLKAAENLKTLSKNSAVETSLSARPYITSYAQEVCTNVIISQAHIGESTLVFLPGYNEIVHYFEHLKSALEQLGVANRFRLFVLHSQVPLEDQRAAFNDPPPSLAHVILATSIAESSITLPKLRMVINFGIHRCIQYDSKRHISCLVKCWCSRASCEQRAGRTGRVFVGTVVHLFTRRFYKLVLPAYDPPEILMSPIAKLVLQAKEVGKKIGHPRPSDFLSLAITPPHLEQLEAALNDLGRFGAIESSPGENVDEEADITFLGRFSLSLPVDLDLSRVVLFGVLFGCAVDAVVVAASMSLLHDVLSLPSRMLIKDEGEFRASLFRSYKNRCALDSESYSDAVMVCNLFKKWLAYRSTCCKEQCSKCALARRFSSMNACRWERLLQLEAIASEIAQKTLHHLPPNSAVYRELKKLASLSTFKYFSHSESSSSSAGDFSIEFCEDVDIIRAILVASYPDQLLYGIRQCESLDDREKGESQMLVELMKNAQVDITRTIVICGGKKSNKTTVEQLAKAVIPNNVFDVNAYGRTYLLTLNHTFETNPLTALLHNFSVAPQFMAGQDQSKIVASTLPLELVLFWQFGERRSQWKAGNIDVSFSRPQHPLATTWFRMTEDMEKVQILSWRNPTGLVCELDQQRKPLPFLAVASHLQGSGNRLLVSASQVSLLPSLHSGRNALILALTFQPPSTEVCAQVDGKYNQIVGLNINSFSLSPFPYDHFLDTADVENMNCLRQAISRAFTSEFTQISAALLSEIPQQLSRLLARGREPRGPRAKANSTREWEEVMGRKRARVDEVIAVESESEGEEEEQERQERKRTSESAEYEYLPSFQCTILERPSEIARDGQEELGQGSANDTTAVSCSDTESESRGRFKLSPNAPVFVPSAPPETELPSTAVHSDLDDRRSSDQSSPQTEDGAAALLPTPNLHPLTLSHFLKPSLFSSMLTLPPNQQRSIWHVLANLDQIMQKKQPAQFEELKPVSPHPPSVPEKPSQPHTSMKRHPEVYRGSIVVEPTLKEGPSQLPPPIPPPCPPVHHSVVHPTTSGRTSQPSAKHLHEHSVRTMTPQFPQPYAAYPSQIPQQSYTASVPSPIPMGLARPISPPLVPHHGYSKTHRNVPPPSVQFPKYVRKPLLIDSLHSKLDLSSRAPGARVGSHYQSRFPAPMSLPHPSPSFFGFGGVSQKTHYDRSRTSSKGSPAAPQHLVSSTHPTASLPRNPREYTIICNALVSYLVTHLQAHGPSGKATSLVKLFLQEYGFPWELGKALYRDLSVICRGRLSLSMTDNEIILSLPQEAMCLPREKREAANPETQKIEIQGKQLEPTAAASGDEIASQRRGDEKEPSMWATATEPRATKEKVPRDSEEQGDHYVKYFQSRDVEDIQGHGLAVHLQPEEQEDEPEPMETLELSTQSESEYTSNPTEEELLDIQLEEEFDIEETLMQEETDEDTHSSAGSEDGLVDTESEDMDITLLGAEEEEVDEKAESNYKDIEVKVVLQKIASVADTTFTESSTKQEKDEGSVFVSAKVEETVAGPKESDVLTPPEIGTSQGAMDEVIASRMEMEQETALQSAAEEENASQRAVEETTNLQTAAQEENEVTSPQSAAEVENEATAPQMMVEDVTIVDDNSKGSDRQMEVDAACAALKEAVAGGNAGSEVNAQQTAVNEDGAVAVCQTALEADSEGTAAQEAVEVIAPLAAVKKEDEPHTALEKEQTAENEVTAPQTTVKLAAPQTAVEKENELAAPQTAVEKENELAAPQTAVEKENELAAPQTAVEKENELTAPQTAVEKENELAAPQTAVEKENELTAPQTAVEKENELTAPQTAVEKENELTAPLTAVEKENELTAPQTAVEKENELTAPQTAVKKKESNAPRTEVENESEVIAPQTTDNEATSQEAVEKESEVTAPSVEDAAPVEENSERSPPHVAVWEVGALRTKVEEVFVGDNDFQTEVEKEDDGTAQQPVEEVAAPQTAVESTVGESKVISPVKGENGVKAPETAVVKENESNAEETVSVAGENKTTTSQAEAEKEKEETVGESKVISPGKGGTGVTTPIEEESDTIAPQTTAESTAEESKVKKENEVTSVQTAIECTAGKSEEIAPVEEKNEVSNSQVEESQAVAPVEATVDWEPAPQTVVKERTAPRPKKSVDKVKFIPRQKTVSSTIPVTIFKKSVAALKKDQMTAQLAVGEISTPLKKPEQALALKESTIAEEPVVSAPRITAKKEKLTASVETGSTLETVEESEVSTAEGKFKSTPRTTNSAVLITHQTKPGETRTPVKKTEEKKPREGLEVTVKECSDVSRRRSNKQAAWGDSSTLPLILRLTDRQLGFVVACLKLVGGHSHIWTLGHIYRSEVTNSVYLKYEEFAAHPGVLRIEGKGCVHLCQDIDEGALATVSLKPKTEELIKKTHDYCPIQERNLGGGFRHGYCTDQTEGGRQRRDKTWRWSEVPRGRQSSSPHFPPRFPKDVKFAKDPGHICHILKFYNDFFASRSEPILYSDLLQEYVSATHLPSDFYLPSDLLRYHFDVYRKDKKRYIRPLKQENSASVSTDGGKGAASDVTKQELTRGDTEKPKRSKRSRKLKSAATGSWKTKRDEGSKPAGKKLSSTRSFRTSQTEGRYEQELLPSSAKSPTEPGHPDHIVKFYTELFASCGEPLPLQGFSVRYIRKYSMPLGFRIPTHFLYKHFQFFSYPCTREWWVCPLSWEEFSNEAPVAPVSRDPLPQKEVWGDEQDTGLPEEEAESGGEKGREEEGKGQPQSVDVGGLLCGRQGGKKESEGGGVKKEEGGDGRLSGPTGGFVKDLPRGGCRGSFGWDLENDDPQPQEEHKRS